MPKPVARLHGQRDSYEAIGSAAECYVSQAPDRVQISDQFSLDGIGGARCSVGPKLTSFNLLYGEVPSEGRGKWTC